MGMPKPQKLILDTAEHHPHHKQWMKMAKEVAETLGIELEVKKEDYEFAIQHGVTDELGMAGLPQIMVELEDGKIVPLLHEIPLDEKFQPDFEKGKQVILQKIEELSKQ